MGVAVTGAAVLEGVEGERGAAGVAEGRGA